MPDIRSHRFGIPSNRHKIPPRLGREGAIVHKSSLYGHKWRQARAIFLRRNPLCEHCQKANPPMVTEANEVDHIIPHKGNMSLFWDRNNWSALCKSCHSKKTARENGGFGNPQAKE